MTLTSFCCSSVLVAHWSNSLRETTISHSRHLPPSMLRAMLWSLHPRGPCPETPGEWIRVRRKGLSGYRRKQGQKGEGWTFLDLLKPVLLLLGALCRCWCCCCCGCNTCLSRTSGARFLLLEMPSSGLAHNALAHYTQKLRNRVRPAKNNQTKTSLSEQNQGGFNLTPGHVRGEGIQEPAEQSTNE